MSTMLPFKPFQPIEWNEVEIIEGAKYKVPSKIPADVEMKRELKLRKEFKKDFPDRPANEYNEWQALELDDKRRQIALMEEVFQPVEGGKPVAYLLEQLSPEELEEVQKHFFPSSKKKKRTESKSIETTGDSTIAKATE